MPCRSAFRSMPGPTPLVIGPPRALVIASAKFARSNSVVVLIQAIIVQSVEHSWVLRDGEQQIAEPAHPIAAEQLVLLQHRGSVVHLGDRRGEMAVPEEGHLLDQLPRGSQ